MAGEGPKVFIHPPAPVSLVEGCSWGMVFFLPSSWAEQVPMATENSLRRRNTGADSRIALKR